MFISYSQQIEQQSLRKHLIIILISSQIERLSLLSYLKTATYTLLFKCIFVLCKNVSINKLTLKWVNKTNDMWKKFFWKIDASLWCLPFRYTIVENWAALNAQ